jgi:hypothetical protein
VRGFGIALAQGDHAASGETEASPLVTRQVFESRNLLPVTRRVSLGTEIPGLSLNERYGQMYGAGQRISQTGGQGMPTRSGTE